MMTFCKKSVHSFLGLSSSSSSSSSKCPMNVDVVVVMDPSPSASCKCHGLVGGGLQGLVSATGESRRQPNLVESSSIKPSPLPLPPPAPKAKRDPGRIGFIDDVGGGIDGLMSCTESLGFESSDERRVDDQIELSPTSTSSSSSSSSNCFSVSGCGYVSGSVSSVRKWRKVEEKREERSFPPPLSSLYRNGHPSFFLRSVRKDGRLELTEVRIDRPEVFVAHREDGRLRLHLLRDQNEELEQEEQEEHEETLMEQEEEEEEEESVKEEWRFPVTGSVSGGGGGEGMKRCHEEAVSQCHVHHHSQHHSNLHVWSSSQHCVT